MADNDMRLKATLTPGVNLLGSLNEVADEVIANITPGTVLSGATPPPPPVDRTDPREREASTSASTKATPEVKELLTGWLTDILRDLVRKPPTNNAENAHAIDLSAAEEELEDDRANHALTDTRAGENTLTAILKKVNEMEDENRSLRDQMKEHQDRVDKIPGAPKLLPKRDMGKFVEQPYTEEAAPYPIPKTFKMPPYLKVYDGTSDPEDHLIHYVTAVKGNDLSKEQVPSVLLKILANNFKLFSKIYKMNWL